MSELKIASNICKACGYCVKYCPKGILELGEAVNEQGYPYVVVTNPEACIGCALCATICPDGVIEVYK